MNKRCPKCGSRWIKQGFIVEPPTITLACEDCGWKEVTQGTFTPAKTDG